MCLFKAYLYVLCGHMDYERSTSCFQFNQEFQHTEEPTTLLSDSTSPPFYSLNECVPRHPNLENGVIGNLDQFYIVLPHEVGPTARWSGITTENYGYGHEEKSLHGEERERPVISGLCATCTAAAEHLIEMHQTLPYFGLAEDMVLDDVAAAAAIPTADNGYDAGYDNCGFYDDENAKDLFYQGQKNHLQQECRGPMDESLFFSDFGCFPLHHSNMDNDNSGMTVDQQFTDQIVLHSPWGKKKTCTVTATPTWNSCDSIETTFTHYSPPPASNTATTGPWKKKNFVENFDILDDPFVVHVDKPVSVMPGTGNEFLSNVTSVMDDDTNSINNYYCVQPQLTTGIHTNNLVLLPKNQQQQEASDNKKKRRAAAFDISSTVAAYPPDATASSNKLHHQGKKTKTSMVPENCPYALRSRRNAPLANGL